MKKLFILTLEVLGGLTGIYFLIFVFYPGSVLNFNIYPESLAFSNSKEIFVKIKPFEHSFQITHSNRHKSHLFWSPNKKHLAFYEKIIEPDRRSFDREWALKVINPTTFKFKTIFIGDYKISHYLWLDDQTVRVFCSGGSGVEIYRDIKINVAEPFIASTHMSPEYWTAIKMTKIYQ